MAKSKYRNGHGYSDHVGLQPHTSPQVQIGYKKLLQASVNGFWAKNVYYFENQLSPKYWLGAF